VSVTRSLGFVLHRYPFQETDLILKVLTPDLGILSVLAKGAKRSKNPAAFEPFQLIEIECFGKKDLKKLRGIESVRDGAYGFRLKDQRLFSAFYINELLAYLIPAAFSSGLSAELFLDYQQALGRLSDPDLPLEPILREFEMTLFKAMGFWPNLSKDQRGEPIHPEVYYALQVETLPRAVLDIPPEEAKIRGYFQGEVLLKMANHDWSESMTLASAKRLLRHWVSFYCEGKVFKSRECLLALQGDRAQKIFCDNPLP
jgi:DNA repair protein RecO (recombination protein O)